MKKTNTHCRTHLHNNFSSQAHCRRAVWFEMLLACLAWTPPHPGGPGATLGPTELPGAHSWWSSFTSWHIWDPSIIHTPGRWSIGVSHHGGTVGVGGGRAGVASAFPHHSRVRICASVCARYFWMAFNVDTGLRNISDDPCTPSDCFIYARRTDGWKVLYAHFARKYRHGIMQTWAWMQREKKEAHKQRVIENLQGPCP